MSMSVSLHMKNAVKFEAKGTANQHSFSDGVYPVVSIDFKDEDSVASNSIDIYASPEQLMQLQKAIVKALRNVDTLKAELEQKLL